MKRILKTAFFCMMLLLIPLCVYGAGTGVYMENCQADGDGLQVLCSRPDGEETVTGENFRLTLEGEELPVASVSTISDEQLPVTVYCLVDVSGSMRDSQMAQAKDALNAVCDGLGAGDNMVITTLGNQTQTSGFLSDTQQIKEIIEQLAAGHEDTNLYAGIVESIGILKTDANVHPKRCLLVLSDGEDDQKSGITREEAERAVKDAHIPIYTVATLSDQPGTDSIEYGKLLGSFARISAGGVHYTPSIDGISGEEAGRDILKGIGTSLVLRAELPESADGRNEMQLRMVYTGSDSSKYEDTLIVYAEDLISISQDSTEAVTEPVTEPDTEPVTEPDTEPDTEPVTEPDTESDSTDGIWAWVTSGNRWIWIAAGAAALIVIVAVVIVIVRSRRKKAKTAMETAAPAASDAVMPPQPSQMPRPSVPQPPLPVSRTQAAPVQANMHQLKLSAIGYPDIVHILKLPEDAEVTLGRNSKADIVLDGKDKKLSGVHCAVKWENEKIFIRDLNSTNGTYVNGVPIQQMGRVAVHKGETITIGSYEYRIG